MNESSPLLIRVGMNGEFSGKNYRVAGRVLMGETEGGETYFWNEFNLIAETGEAATLVFEETESGGQWRMFTLFEPSNPMMAADAATKRVGNWVDLDGTSARVTLVGQSKVYQIEGEAPEGVEQGDAANYFNAEAGRKMTVVSWTGDEVECYHGITITSGMVAKAFNIDQMTLARLSLAARANYSADDDDDSSSSRFSMSPGVIKMIVAAAAIGVAIFAAKGGGSAYQQSSSVKRVAAPALTITNGSTGRLRGTGYRVVGRSDIEIAETSVMATRHELYLRDDAGGEALLVNELTPGAKDWGLFTQLYPAQPLTPQKAGGVRTGQTLDVGGNQVRVTELYRATILAEDRPDMLEFVPSKVFFGFGGKSGTNVIFARWNQYGIKFFTGQAVDGKEVSAAFSGKN